MACVRACTPACTPRSLDFRKGRRISLPLTCTAPHCTARPSPTLILPSSPPSPKVGDVNKPPPPLPPLPQPQIPHHDKAVPHSAFPIPIHTHYRCNPPPGQPLAHQPVHPFQPFSQPASHKPRTTLRTQAPKAPKAKKAHPKSPDPARTTAPPAIQEHMTSQSPRLRPRPPLRLPACQNSLLLLLLLLLLFFFLWLGPGFRSQKIGKKKKEERERGMKRAFSTSFFYPQSHSF
ncbi:hypothetical protein BS50DRAFT_328391 [Corynespora cassiicola Philippines]|uniref:Uncharacterized protein n=1 Tax=Corynespora cassiicola Philippines TaxID=1448308 RepID=A0A2T2NU13_CORCC|nr:hypothetical protein BS50DRAFT_328391 [Corynespora cassiicola Philippines]